MKTVKHLVLLAALALFPAALHAQEDAPVHGTPAAAEADGPAVASKHGEAGGHAEAAQEHGAPGAHHSMFDTTENAKGVSPRASFIFAVVNFLLLVTLLVYLLRKPLAQFLVSRREDVRKSIDEAKEAKEKAEKVLAEYRGRMDNLENELNTLRAEIMAAGERERDSLLQAAKVQSAKIVADAGLIGEQEVRRAKAVLREEMVKLAAELAQVKLTSQVTAQERDKQIGDFISKLEAL